MRSITAWINPLAFLDIDAPPAPNLPAQPSPESVLAFMCPAVAPADMATLSQRYKEITSEPVALSVVPAEARILDKLVWPLRHAKAS